MKGVFKDHAAATNPWLNPGSSKGSSKSSPQSSPESIVPAGGGGLPADESIAPNAAGGLAVDGFLEVSVDGADERVNNDGVPAPVPEVVCHGTPVGGVAPNGSPGSLHSEISDWMPPSPIGSPCVFPGTGGISPNPLAPPLDAEATGEGLLEAPVETTIDGLEIMEDIPEADPDGVTADVSSVANEGGEGPPGETGIDDLEIMDEDANISNEEEEEDPF